MILPTQPTTEPAIVQRAPLFDLLRCHCSECLNLDRQFPGQGFQLSLLRWIEMGFQA